MTKLNTKQYEKFLEYKDIRLMNFNNNWKITNYDLEDYNINLLAGYLEIIYEIMCLWWHRKFVVENITVNFANNIAEENPVCFFELNLITLGLNLKGDFGCKTIYQIAHEITHFIIQYRIKKNIINNRWFEEVICELASQEVLLYLSKSWDQRSFMFNKFQNREAVKKYLNDIKIKTNKISKFNLYDKYKDELHKDEYIRDINAKFAMLIREEVKIDKFFWSIIVKFFSEYNEENFVEGLKRLNNNCSKYEKKTVEKITNIFTKVYQEEVRLKK